MPYFVVDDPMLALIARFAGCCATIDISEEDFLRQQLGEIRGYVDRFSPEQKQEKALEWIARYAEQYRDNWRKNLVSSRASTSYCPDCPLERQSEAESCEIHNGWLEVLNQYVAGDSSSRQYVEDSLELLRRHKEKLKRGLSSASNA